MLWNTIIYQDCTNLVVTRHSNHSILQLRDNIRSSVPLTCVTYDDALEFCRTKVGRDYKTYNLVPNASQQINDHLGTTADHQTLPAIVVREDNRHLPDVLAGTAQLAALVFWSSQQKLCDDSQ